MRAIALVAACLACTGRARRMQLNVERTQGHSPQQNDTEDEVFEDEEIDPSLGQVLTTLEKHGHETVFDLGSVVEILKVDVPAILHKEPHWSIFAKDFQISDDSMNSLLEGLPKGKMLSRLLRELGRKFVVNESVQIQSIGGLEDPFDPFVVVGCHLQLSAEKNLLKFWQQRGVIVDIQVKATFRLNAVNQVERLVIDEVHINGDRLLADQISDLVLSDDLVTNMHRIEAWILAHKPEDNRRPRRNSEASDIGLQSFLLQTDKSSLEFANYCKGCGRSQYACVQGKARGRCSRTPWSVNEGCERGADCSNVLPDRQAQAASSSSRFSLGAKFGGAKRLVSGDCRRCLKECIGAPLQKAQLTSMKIQAPLGFIYAMIFKNRPIKMWPIQPILKELAHVNPLFYGAAGAGVYMSCRNHCEYECPYPGAPSDDQLRLPELDRVDPNDISFLKRLYSGGRQQEGEFAQAIRGMFSVPGL